MHFQHRDIPSEQTSGKLVANAPPCREAEVKASLVIGMKSGEAHFSSPIVFFALCQIAEQNLWTSQVEQNISGDPCLPHGEAWIQSEEKIGL